VAPVSTRTLAELFQELPILNDFPPEEVLLTGISIDSRQVKEGNLFIAIPGTKTDGHDFVQAAVGQGAAVVAGSRSFYQYQNLPVPYLQINQSREALAKLAAAWYGYPARSLVVIGVTGTEGKTTTVNLIHQILMAAGLQAGLISTVNAVIGNQTIDTGFHVTTPEAMDLQRYLLLMVEAGITHVVIEATSHGLAQQRVAACEFDIGVVTNITHEHLDFHDDYQSYLDAKSELIRLIPDSKQKPAHYEKLAVLNIDDGSYSKLKQVAEKSGVKTVDYGVGQESDFQAKKIKHNKMKVHTSLLGDYNVSNCLAAAAVCFEGLGITWGDIRAGIKNLEGIPGRMELLDLGQDFYTIVDFAHSPNALNRAISAARNLTSQRVITVFGSAGLRDKEKRKLMGQISAELADITILTAEDPRTESLDDILEEMAEGVISKGRSEGENFWRIPDRGKAIQFAVQLAEAQDVVLICGKGHEQSMCFGETEYPWDDRTALTAALAEHLNLEGPEMPYLPTRGS
jgi:UDP-N-acetylmuramoyl-L-alanyl-D-glutamate--2,6-diaminopimelate ligase